MSEGDATYLSSAFENIELSDTAHDFIKNEIVRHLWVEQGDLYKIRGLGNRSAKLVGQPTFI